MASYVYNIVEELAPQNREKAVQMAKEMGYSESEASRMISKKRHSGRLIQVQPNYSPFHL